MNPRAAPPHHHAQHADAPNDRAPNDLAPDDELALLYLAALRVKGLGHKRLRQLVTALGSLQRAKELPSAELRGMLPGAPAVAERLGRELGALTRQAASRLREMRSAGLTVLTCEHAAFPPSLHDDPLGPVPLLFVEGQLPPQLGFGSSTVRACAVVGTRNPTRGGRSFARDLGRALAREGILVVSGLALGIDGAAHEGALDAVAEARPSAAGAAPPRARYRWREEVAPTPQPAGTVAVLGGGHRHLHPAAHRPLAKRILAAGGAIVSLWEPDVTPERHHFPIRNRVVSGLSRIVAVIEAREDSGTNSTVEHATEQGRTVMAVPGAPWMATSHGGLGLLRDGVPPIFDPTDVIHQFSQLLPLSDREVAARAELFAAAADPLPAADGADVMTGAPPATHERLRELLEGGAELPLDAISASLRLPRGELLALLSRLELAGELEATSGGRYRRRG